MEVLGAYISARQALIERLYSSRLVGFEEGGGLHNLRQKEARKGARLPCALIAVNLQASVTLQNCCYNPRPAPYQGAVTVQELNQYFHQIADLQERCASLRGYL